MFLCMKGQKGFSPIKIMILELCDAGHDKSEYLDLLDPPTI